MKHIKKYACLLMLLFAVMQTSCTDGFENMNRNPESLPTVSPEKLFYTAETEMLTAAHCWNSIYASKYRWMQYGVGIWGYNLVNYTYFNTRIGDAIYNEYINMGSYVTNMEYLADNHENKDNYSDLKQMGRIMLIAKGIQASDLFGSLAYSQGWLARKGKVDDASMTPEFETQEQLSEVWDKQLKECIENLKKSGASQVSMKGNDRAYNGDKDKWIKAANGIRLRLASRLWKRKPDVAKAIAAEVLSPSNASNVFSSNDDSFILWFDNLYANIHPGDWHSVKDMEIATYAIMNYLNKNEDPRKRMYFIINNLTPENIKAFNAEQSDVKNLIPEDYTRWEGSSVGYDNWTGDRRRTRLYLGSGPNRVDMRPANTPQVRLWKGNDTEGNGGNWAPVMTYPDFCFLAAEFVLREGLPSSKTARQWYEDGLKASLDQWNRVGKFCDITDYQAMTEDEIAVFLGKPDVKWDESKALEQIYAQSYIEHYKNVDEMYALWKRVKYPDWGDAGIIKFERPLIQDVYREIPRRVKFFYPNDGVHNYDNLKKRLDVMLENPEFGGDLNNEFGRHWWDKE
jgi:hypothetical protein